MKAIKQEDPLGCAIACVAFVLGISYKNSLELFEGGKIRAIESGFYCKDIVLALRKAGLECQFKYIKSRIRHKIYKRKTIGFIKRSREYPAGHYLVRANSKWMDPWINFPNKNIEAGFRKRLPGKPIYIIYQVSSYNH